MYPRCSLHHLLHRMSTRHRFIMPHNIRFLPAHPQCRYSNRSTSLHQVLVLVLVSSMDMARRKVLIILPTHTNLGTHTTLMARQTPTPQRALADHQGTHYTSLRKAHPTHLRSHQDHLCPPYTPILQHRRCPSHNPRSPTPLRSSPPSKITRISRLRGTIRGTRNTRQQCPCLLRRPRNPRNKTWAYRMRHRLSTIMGTGTSEDFNLME